MSKRTIFSMHLSSLVPVHRVTLKMFALLNVSLQPLSLDPRENRTATAATAAGRKDGDNNDNMMRLKVDSYKICSCDFLYVMIRDKTDTDINRKIDDTSREAWVNVFLEALRWWITLIYVVWIHISLKRPFVGFVLSRSSMLTRRNDSGAHLCVCV